MKTMKLELVLKVNGKLVNEAASEFPIPKDGARLQHLIESHLEWLMDDHRQSDASDIISIANSAAD